METDAPLPDDLHIAVRAASSGTLVEIGRRGQLVVARRGGARVGAASTIKLAVEHGAEADAPIVVETTKPDTLETTRFVVHLGVADDRPTFAARLAEPPTLVARDARARHVCRAHETGGGGVAVLCSVDGAASAASVTAEDPRAGVIEMPGKRSLVRFDFDADGAAVEAKALAYNAAGTGVLVRVEMALLPDEPRPTITIVSAERAQPVRLRPICGLVCVF